MLQNDGDQSHTATSDEEGLFDSRGGSGRDLRPGHRPDGARLVRVPLRDPPRHDGHPHGRGADAASGSLACPTMRSAPPTTPTAPSSTASPGGRSVTPAWRRTRCRRRSSGPGGRRRPTTPPGASQRTWLFAILRNVVIDFARARRVRPPLATGEPDDRGAQPTTSSIACSPRGRWRRRWPSSTTTIGGCWWRSTGAAGPTTRSRDDLGIPAGTVKSRVYYGLRAMRSALEAQGWRDG